MSTETISPATIAQGSTFVWHECYAPDAQKAIDFYTKALDFGTQDFPMEGMGTYRMLTREGKGFCALFSPTRRIMKAVPLHWPTIISFDVVDLRLENASFFGPK